MEDGGSAKETLLLFVSAIQEGMLDVGRPFIIMLTEMAILFKEDIQNALKDNMPLFKELAVSLVSAMKIIVPMALDALPSMIQALKAIVPIIVVLAGAFRILMAILQPVFQLLSGIGNIIMGVIQMLSGDVKGGFATFATGAKDTLIGGAITLAGMATGGLAGGIGMMSAAAGGTAVRLGTQRAISAATMGLGGLATEDRVNNNLSVFAEGGFVNGPTVGLVGEAGPEVVIPLGAGKEGRRDALAASAGLGGMEVSIGDIVINGGSNLSIAEVRALMSSEMPRILRQELLRGTRGVI